MTAVASGRRSITAAVLTLLGAGGCAGRPAAPPPVVPATGTVPADAVQVAPPAAPEPLLPPQAARLLGLLPRRTVGAEQFLAEHPAFDGRGVLIAILDSGVDPTVPGLRTTTTGQPKILDVRDFSGEGRIPLHPIQPVGDMVTVGDMVLGGFARVRGLASGTAFGGLLVERHLGAMPAADVNGDGDRDDVFPLVVARATDGWFVIADTDGDGSLAGESPVRDFGYGDGTLAFGPVAMAVNLHTDEGRPLLDLVFDTSGHGTHVAGIAAGHELFGVPGFDGLAPGAQLLGLKIANDARGGISVTGSMVRAMEHAAAFATARRMPLVLNLSFGIGNEDGSGSPVIDSLIDEFALRHPDIVFVISAGNDGPGVSTIGFPGSAEFALSACALFPGVFAQAPSIEGPAVDDVLGWWSARGGVFAKPDVCVPGVAFSNVPAWQTGEEVSGGTSMAAPQLAGIAALLQSAELAQDRTTGAASIAAALRATATPVAGATWIDAGAGVPDVAAAFRWLQAGHRAGRFRVRAERDGANTGYSAAYRRNGIAPGDTLQRFTVTSEEGQPFARLILRPDATWLQAPGDVVFSGQPVTVPVTYDLRGLQAPGLHVGTVWARPATDTSAGAAFGLTSTVVVPYELHEPLRARQYVAKGRSVRFFLDVPSGAAGLVVRAHVPDEEQAVSLYLFEPSGQPQRDVSVLEIGGQFPATGELIVRAEDLLPGVYEAVLVAPPTRSATVEFGAQLAPLDYAGIGAEGVRFVNRGPEPLTAAVSIQAVGAGRRLSLRGGSTVTARERLRVPAWADRMRIDVRFPPARWQSVTDVGVSLWDTAGHLVKEGPLNYAFGRQTIELDAETPRTMDLEIMPGFAMPGDDASWEAEILVAYLPALPIDTPVTRQVTVAAETSLAIPWPDDSLAWLPAGLDVLREASITATGQATTLLQVLQARPVAAR